MTTATLVPTSQATLATAPVPASGTVSSVNPLTLAELPPDNTATIVALHVGQEYGRRMAGLGLRPGVTVRVIRASPLDGPLQVRTGHTDLILRRSDAARIEVRAIT